MHKKNMYKAIIAIAVAMAFIMPVAAFANIGEIENEITVDATMDNGGQSSEVLQTDWWPMFHHDLGHSGYSTSTAPDTANLLWSYPTGGKVRSSPAVVDEKVYFGSYDGNLYCLNTDGTYDWTYDISSYGNEVPSSPAVADGKVYIGSFDCMLHCVNAVTGDGIWAFEDAEDYVPASPAVADGQVYIGSIDPCIFFCLDTEGDVLWEGDGGGAMYAGAAVADGKVYVGSTDDHLYCFDTTNGDELWAFWTSSGGDVKTTPAVVDGQVYFGSTDGYVYCLDTSGNKLWEYNTVPEEAMDDVYSSPAVADGKVYFGSTYGVHCLNTDGEELWVFDECGAVKSSPAVADGKVYFGSDDDNVYCVDASTGTLIWSYLTGGDVRSSPAIADGKVYVGSADGNLYCFGAAPPPDLWWPMFRHNLERSGFSTSTAPNTDTVLWTAWEQVATYPSSTPAVTNGKMYVASEDGMFYCLDANTGAELWNHLLPNRIQTSPAVADGKGYMGTNDGNLYCLDANTGNELWVFAIGDYVYHSSPAVVDGKVYIGSRNSNLYCIDADTGIELWNYTTGDRIYHSSPAVVDGKVYVGSDALYCIDADTGIEQWVYTEYLDMSSPAVAYNKVYIGDDEGVFHCIDADTGLELWNYPTTTGESGLDACAPAVADGKVYFVGDRLYCLDATTGSAIWKFAIGADTETHPVIAYGILYVVSQLGDIYAFKDPDPTITSLSEKWNMFSTPFDYSVAKADIIVEYDGTDYTWADAVTEGIVADALFGWDRTATPQQYKSYDILDPGCGYWLWAYYECVLSVS